MDRKEREWDASLCTLKWAGSFFIFLFFFLWLEVGRGWGRKRKSERRSMDGSR